MNSLSCGHTQDRRCWSYMPGGEIVAHNRQTHFTLAPTMLHNLPVSRHGQGGTCGPPTPGETCACVCGTPRERCCRIRQRRGRSKPCSPVRRVASIPRRKQKRDTKANTQSRRERRRERGRRRTIARATTSVFKLEGCVVVLPRSMRGCQSLRGGLYALI